MAVSCSCLLPLRWSVGCYGHVEMPVSHCTFRHVSGDGYARFRDDEGVSHADKLNPAQQGVAVVGEQRIPGERLDPR